ncbi:MAG: signal peptidase II [Deltaproteobacteria bacterium]|nr:signal peptidase II [Deltaproteobacteria bacterium]
MIIFILGAAAIVVLDQITKAAIVKNFILHEARPVIEGFFNLVYVMNPGAAFGFLAGASETFRYLFFIGITVLVIVLIIYYIAESKSQNMLFIISMTLIFAGAVGNLIDRIRYGAVVDFLDFYIRTWHWPAFNVADSSISLGAVLMIWGMITQRKKQIAS